MRFIFLMLFSVSAFAADRTINLSPKGDNSDTVNFEIWGNYLGDQERSKMMELPKGTVSFTIQIDGCRMLFIQARACTIIDCTDDGTIMLVEPECVLSDPPSLSKG